MAAVGEPRGLVALPGESISNIAGSFESDDLFAFRLTCRALEAKSFALFTENYFESRCVIFTTQSLQNLKRIAEHQRFRTCLQALSIATVIFDHKRSFDELERPLLPGIPRLQAQHIAAWNDYVADQKQLRQLGTRPGGDQRYLIDAFQQLPALREIGVIDISGPIPEQTICYGINTITRRTGDLPPWPSAAGNTDQAARSRYVQHVFNATLMAIAKSKISGIDRLDLCGVPSVFTQKAACKKMTQDLSACLQSLNAIFVQIDHLFPRNRNEIALSAEQEVNVASYARALSRTFANAKEFSFSGAYDAFSGRVVKGLLTSIDLGKLSSFHLKEVKTDVQSLAKILCCLKNANHICLERISLLSEGSWVSILEALVRLPKLAHLDMISLEEKSRVMAFKEILRPLYPDSDTTSNPGSTSCVLGEGTGLEMIVDILEEGSMPSSSNQQSLNSGEDISHDGQAIPGSSTPLSVENLSKHNVMIMGSPKALNRPLVFTPPEPDCHYRKYGAKYYIDCLTGPEIRRKLPLIIENYKLTPDQYAGFIVPSHQELMGDLLGDVIVEVGQQPPTPVPASQNPFIGSNLPATTVNGFQVAFLPPPSPLPPPTSWPQTLLMPSLLPQPPPQQTTVAMNQMLQNFVSNMFGPQPGAPNSSAVPNSGPSTVSTPTGSGVGVVPPSQIPPNTFVVPYTTASATGPTGVPPAHPGPAFAQLSDSAVVDGVFQGGGGTSSAIFSPATVAGPANPAESGSAQTSSQAQIPGPAQDSGVGPSQPLPYFTAGELSTLTGIGPAQSSSQAQSQSFPWMSPDDSISTPSSVGSTLFKAGKKKTHDSAFHLARRRSTQSEADAVEREGRAIMKKMEAEYKDCGGLLGQADFADGSDGECEAE